MSTTLNDLNFGIDPMRMHRLSVVQVHQMLATGILRDGEPIELIDGLLVQKDRRDRGGEPMTHGELHAETVERLQGLQPRVVEMGYRFRIQLPITLSLISQPEPDVAIVRGSIGERPGQHPIAEEVAAVIEVAYSSLAYDRTTKQRIYAKAGIPGYWIVDLQNRVFELYERPLPDCGLYQQRTIAQCGDVAVLRISANSLLDVHVSEIFP